MQNQNKHQTPAEHIPVLLNATLELLQPRLGDRYLDLTAGYGGHALAILKSIGSNTEAILVDRDPAAISALQAKLGNNATIIHSDYAHALTNLTGKFDIILADLGVSSPQLDNSIRGFSFKSNGPLDMRMDNSRGQTAAELINSASEIDLANLIYEYGEERQSRIIARAIVGSRPFFETKKLADTISQVYRGRSRIHPATRTFQALRIAVNDELRQLAIALPQIESLLKPGGRMAIISFHSLEDRIVKRFIKSSEVLAPINKNVVQGKINDVSNPRARSAKLRSAIKNTNAARQNKKEKKYGD